MEATRVLKVSLLEKDKVKLGKKMMKKNITPKKREDLIKRVPVDQKITVANRCIDWKEQ